ncbi:MAG: hypothetical protein KBE65_15700 [Phycisphaerae bacterium]|nr:hypothetical protein [Phycisphaerae bacterium]
MTEDAPVSDVAANQPRDVAPDEIYELLPSSEPKPKSFIESWGVRFMLVLLIAIVLITGVFLFGWLVTRPTMSDVTTILEPKDANDASALTARIDALEKLCQNHLDNYRDLFQLLILGGLVPLFTLIAGYVFGRNQAERKQQEET